MPPSAKKPKATQASAPAAAPVLYSQAQQQQLVDAVNTLRVAVALLTVAP